jgi:3-carboxy-cis,cis-muconate cycloisomerase
MRAGVGALFVDPDMAAIWSGKALVANMLAFEAALARAEGRAGVIPPTAAEAIGDTCRVEDFDAPAIFREASVAGVPAIPLVRLLTEKVAEEGRGYVHWGATSQDAVDTALVLQMRAGIELLLRRLYSIGEVCAEVADQHRLTPMAGRTLLQQATPIPFGLKAARWLALITRQMRRLSEIQARSLVVQLGGAAGTLAALGDAGPRVVELLAEELGLSAPDLPWHAERDRIAEVAGALGIVGGAMSKIAQDLVLLAQTEVGEVTEAAGPSKGVSSTMPQKRNPVDATLARSSARLALGIVPVLLATMEQEHERAAGAWQTEWEALPRLFGYVSGAVTHVHGALTSLEVDRARVRANLDLTRGAVMAEALSMALARQLGRQEAHAIVRELVERATREDTSLEQSAANDERVRAVVNPEELAQIFTAERYFGSADLFIDRALAGFRTSSSVGATHDDIR